MRSALLDIKLFVALIRKVALFFKSVSRSPLSDRKNALFSPLSPLVFEAAMLKIRFPRSFLGARLIWGLINKSEVRFWPLYAPDLKRRRAERLIKLLCGIERP